MNVSLKDNTMRYQTNGLASCMLHPVRTSLKAVPDEFC